MEIGDEPTNAYEEALIAFGGPFVGGLGAAACSLAASSLESQLLFAVADIGFFLNAINLLPLGTMDGGRIASAIHKHTLLVGLGIGVGALWYLPIYNPFAYLIVLSVAYTTGKRYYADYQISKVRDSCL